MKISKQLLVYLSLITVTACIWLSMTFSGVLDGIEEETLRWRYLVRGELQSKAPIIYVDLDAEMDAGITVCEVTYCKIHTLIHKILR